MLPPVTLPVVIHIVHGPGDVPGSVDHPDDGRVLAGLQAINAIFAGGPICPGLEGGTPTGIGFCLATRDALGGVTSGIVRHVAALTDFDLCTQDEQLKALAGVLFPPDQYINIFLVRSICASCLPYDCAVAGVSTYPANHGRANDGLVLEARDWGTEDCTRLVNPVHELGHYFNLLHTFHEGCQNDDCLADGDRVCDTPPDAEANVYPFNPCLGGGFSNSCSSDVNAADPNNPLTEDAPDPDDNFMDYAPNGCARRFSAGQAARMQAAVYGPRASLLSSRGCMPPCAQSVTAAFLAPDTLWVGSVATFSNQGAAAGNYEWEVEGQVFTNFDLSYTFSQAGTYEVRLHALSPEAGCDASFSAQVEVRCPLRASLHSSGSLYTPGDTALLINTSPAQTGVTYQWWVNGQAVVGGDSLLLDLAGEGNYIVSLQACGGGCCAMSPPLHLRAGQCESPRVYENWAVGIDSIWISFANGSPQIRSERMHIWSGENIVVMSDTAGQILFYSNGSTIINGSHLRMLNGQTIAGNASSTQCLALRRPGSWDEYFLFYPQAYYTSNPGLDTTARLHYARIDMNGDGGRGEVVEKNVLLLQPTTEKVTAARHCNGVDWWVLGHEAGSNRFFAWLLTEDGLQPPVISSVGRPNSGIRASKAGAMKLSHDLRRIAMATIHDFSVPLPYNGYTELFDFDNASGLVSNPVLLQNSMLDPYGIEFSPNNQLLYVMTGTSRLYQFDLSQADVAGSELLIYQYPPFEGQGGMLELGPDGLIYAANIDIPYTDAILAPNERGAACRFTPRAIDLGGRQGRLGLSNRPANAYRPDQPFLAGPRHIDLCEDGGPQAFFVQSNCSHQDYVWEVLGDAELLATQGDTAWVAPRQAGSFSIIVHKTTACRSLSDTIAVVVRGCAPEPCSWDFNWIETDTLVCAGEVPFMRFSATFDEAFVYEETLGQERHVQGSSFALPAQLSSTQQCYTLRLQRLQEGCDTLISFCVQHQALPPFEWMRRDTVGCSAQPAVFHFRAPGRSAQLISLDHPGMRSVAEDAPWTIGPIEGDSCFLLRVFNEALGCDTLISFCVAYEPEGFVIHESAVICAGDSIAYRGQWLDAAGTYQWQLPALAGCDTSLVFTLDVLSAVDTTLVQRSSCNPAEVGEQVLVLSTAQGCDSVLIIQTALLPSDTTILNLSTCNPNEAGTQSVVLVNQWGCDSTLLIHTIFDPGLIDTTLVQRSSCNPTEVGEQVLVLSTAQGCDSVLVIQTALLPSDTTTLNLSTCNPNEVGSQSLVLSNQWGCDSTLLIHTVFDPGLIDTTLMQRSSCNPTEVGEQVLVLSTAQGCDSVLVIQTALLPSDTTTLNLSTCNPNEAGTQSLVLSNQWGCDSTLLIHTVFDPGLIDTTLVQRSSCNPAEVGEQVLVLSTAQGCDSVLIIQTALLPSDTTTLNLSTCNPDEVGSQSLVLSNQWGCDSTLLIHTVFDPGLIDTTLVQRSSCNPAEVGEQVLVLSAAQDCDSVLIIQTALLPSDTTILNLSTCNPDEVGTQSLVLSNQWGCDSLVVTHWQYEPPDLIAGIRPDTTLLPGQSLNLYVELLRDAQVEWQPSANVVCPSCAQTLAWPQTSTRYTLTATDEDGCSASAQVWVQVDYSRPFYAPNAFSPNGDGINDYFTIYSAEGGFTIEDISIFNRWGGLVFHQQSPLTNVVWDGTAQNRPVEAGLYVFTATLRWPDGRISQVSGEMMVVR